MTDDPSTLKLMAEMLAALKAAAAYLHDNCEDDEPLRQIRQAIAKAEKKSIYAL